MRAGIVAGLCARLAAGLETSLRTGLGLRARLIARLGLCTGPTARLRAGRRSAVDRDIMHIIRFVAHASITAVDGLHKRRGNP